VKAQWAFACGRGDGIPVRVLADDLHLWSGSTKQMPRRAIHALRAQAAVGSVDAKARGHTAPGSRRLVARTHGWPAVCAAAAGQVHAWAKLMPWVFWPEGCFKSPTTRLGNFALRRLAPTSPEPENVARNAPPAPWGRA
jgi:hypothetical protein